ncbi:PH domain-containing protein [Paraliobacillus sediminis]|uniref:PH domain-containing protein n=1 Tax=Paraliobacillus sediminis TaxID=1885916 RepID=UPI000E3C25A6|nr:PH domain-containing protein [Paraliobacillus sediminis]
MGFMDGLLGNYSEVTIDELHSQYDEYLMLDEQIQMGFKLVRDTFIFTEKRLILLDHQGVTGKKTRILSISMDAIFDVTLETGGTGFDDSELTVHYIVSPYYRANNVETSTYTFEFGKKFNVQPIYVALTTLAHENRTRINK